MAKFHQIWSHCRTSIPLKTGKRRSIPTLLFVFSSQGKLHTKMGLDIKIRQAVGWHKNEIWFFMENFHLMSLKDGLRRYLNLGVLNSKLLRISNSLFTVLVILALIWLFFIWAIICFGLFYLVINCLWNIFYRSWERTG